MYTYRLINLLQALVFASLSNHAVGRKKGDEYKTVKERIEQGIDIDTKDVIEWAWDAVQFDLDSAPPLKKLYDHLELLSTTPFGHAKLQNLTVKQTLARMDAITEQGNYIPYMNISIGSYTRKPTIVVVAGIYGCEWLGVVSVLNMIQELACNYYKYTDILQKVIWILIPVLNPDGYNATFYDKTMRTWRKNMFRWNHSLEKETSSENETFSNNETSRNKKKKCFGVNLALNFEYQWLNYDYENITMCEDNFADKPFSQIESRALRDTLQSNLDSVKIFVSIHQIRRAVTYPYRHTSEKPLFSDVFEDIVKSAAEAAQRQHGREFKYGHITTFAKKSAGTADDWIKAHLNVHLAFTCFVSDLTNHDNISNHEFRMTNAEVLAALEVIATKGVEFDTSRYIPTSLGTYVSLTGQICIFGFLIIINL